MDFTLIERAAVVSAARAAALQALRAVNHLRPGRRVIYRDADGWHYCTVHDIGQGRDGSPVVSLRFAGMVGLVGATPDQIRPVCGTCPDCRALNDRPACVLPEFEDARFGGL